MQLMTSVGVQGSLFHCIARTNGRFFGLKATEADYFRGLMRRVEAFSGVEVITWTVLANHFHLVVHIPEKVEDLPEDVFWERMRALYQKDEIDEIRETMRLIPILTPGLAGQHLLRDYRMRFIRRMHDLSEFMKTLLSRFTRWFNRRHQRVGRLWETRFKSVLIEDGWDPLMCVAAYVDLNAVRAGLVKDPAAYRWCGYAEAVAGNTRARKGLGHLMLRESQATGNAPNWRLIGREYRKILFGMGEAIPDADGEKGRPGMSREAVSAVQQSDGQLTRSQLLRFKWRYFTQGVVIGSKAFVEKFFHEKRDFFGERRKDGARKMRGGDWGELQTVRELKH